MDASPSAQPSTASTSQPPVLVKTEEQNRSVQAPPPGQQAHRQVRYKDRFQVLRERYDRVNVLHVQYERTLQHATDKERRMQAEIDMLLDAAMNSEIMSDVAPYMGPEPMHDIPSLGLRPNAAYALDPHAAYPNGSTNGNGYDNIHPAWRPPAPSDVPVLEYVHVDPGRRAP